MRPRASVRWLAVAAMLGLPPSSAVAAAPSPTAKPNCFFQHAEICTGANSSYNTQLSVQDAPAFPVSSTDVEISQGNHHWSLHLSSPDIFGFRTRADQTCQGRACIQYIKICSDALTCTYQLGGPALTLKAEDADSWAYAQDNTWLAGTDGRSSTFFPLSQLDKQRPAVLPPDRQPVVPAP